MDHQTRRISTTLSRQDPPQNNLQDKAVHTLPTLTSPFNTPAPRERRLVGAPRQTISILLPGRLKSGSCIIRREEGEGRGTEALNRPLSSAQSPVSSQTDLGTSVRDEVCCGRNSLRSRGRRTTTRPDALGSCSFVDHQNITDVIELIQTVQSTHCGSSSAARVCRPRGKYYRKSPCRSGGPRGTACPIAPVVSPHRAAAPCPPVQEQDGVVHFCCFAGYSHTSSTRRGPQQAVGGARLCSSSPRNHAVHAMNENATSSDRCAVNYPPVNAEMSRLFVVLLVITPSLVAVAGCHSEL